MKKLTDALCMTFGMFSLIPVPRRWDDKSATLVMPLMPLVGLVVGAVWTGVAALAIYFALPALIAAALIMFTPWVTTGLIHIDGFIDTCDALLSRADREKKIAILKDSHVDAFGVVALIILCVFAFSASATLASDPGFTIASHKWYLLGIIPVISRSLTAFFQLTLKPLHSKGYGVFFSKDAGFLQKLVPLLTAALAIASCVIFFRLTGLCVSLAMCAVFLLAIWRAYRSMGGLSGDLSGYSLTISEIAGLIALSIANF